MTEPASDLHNLEVLLESHFPIIVIETHEEVRAVSLLDRELHLQKCGLDVKKVDIKLIARESEGFSGAELEQVIVSARYAAFATDNKIDTDDLIAEIKQTQPLSVVMAETIQQLRAWAKTRTVNAH